MKPETLQDLRDELSVIEEQLKGLKARRSGIKKILKMEIVPEQNEEKSGSPDLTEEKVPSVFKVPLDHDFQVFLDEQWHPVKAKDFRSGDIISVLRKGNVIPIHGTKVMEVVKALPKELIVKQYQE